VEVGRRIKRSFDGQISYRKAGLVGGLIFLFLLYLRWFTGYSSRSLQTEGLTPLQTCVKDKLSRWSEKVEAKNAHLDTQGEFIPYIGNGYFGMTIGANSEINIKSRRTLSIGVHYKPLVQLTLDQNDGGEEAVGLVTDYTTGIVSKVQCLATEEGTVTVTTGVYAHRTIPGVLVQDIKINNPTTNTVQLGVEKLGISNWNTAKSSTRVIEYGDGGNKYSIVTGTVENIEGKKVVVAVASRKLSTSMGINGRMTHNLHLLTGLAYSDPIEKYQNIDEIKLDMEKQAMNSVSSAAAMTTQKLLDSHVEVWRHLWTTGFGISWSYAEEAINGDRINVTMYYVLSQSPTPLHSSTTSQGQQSELQGFLSYTEGCYSGIRTLQANNLWTPLSSIAKVDTVVSYWLLNLEKNGCHNLLRAGADGVIQAMVLSLPGLRYNNHHLELNVHPRELHRDSSVRRLNYGNETHVNISITVMEDNRAAILVSLDKRDKDYYACDAGCLDPPVKLGLTPQQFPVKLTDPITAILYITADEEHMTDLKHTIHVKELVEAPAHEQHVLELHRTGARIGGLHPVFWIAIASIIVIFHLFLFRLIYNEYCAGPSDKYRIRKYSDYG